MPDKAQNTTKSARAATLSRERAIAKAPEGRRHSTAKGALQTTAEPIEPIKHINSALPAPSANKIGPMSFITVVTSLGPQTLCKRYVEEKDDTLTKHPVAHIWRGEARTDAVDWSRRSLEC